MVLCKTMYTLISIYLWGGFVSSQCFFPDGTPTKDVYDQDGYYPCNSTTGGQASSCCQLTTSACTTEGYCIGNNGYAYRGACTNSSFPLPCPQYCLNISTSRYSTFFPRGSENGQTDFHCWGITVPGTSYNSPDCCNESFRGIQSGNPFVPLSYAEAHESASNPTTSSSSASTTISNAPTISPPSASSSSSASTTVSPSSASPATSLPINESSSSSLSSHYIAIGAGVGVPLGVALLLGLCFLLYHERKQRLKLESLLRDNLPRGRHEKVSQAPAVDGMPHELGGNYNNELGGNPIHEANETH